MIVVADYNARLVDQGTERMLLLLLFGLIHCISIRDVKNHKTSIRDLVLKASLIIHRIKRSKYKTANKDSVLKSFTDSIYLEIKSQRFILNVLFKKINFIE